MPYVLTQKLQHSGYSDTVGAVYHVPARLFRLLGGIQEGHRFVYYQPKEGADGRVFFGEGVVHHVDATSDPVRVSLRDYAAFPKPVPKLLPDGSFAETGSNSSPFYLWSVRFISDDDIDRIARVGGRGGPAA